MRRCDDGKTDNLTVMTMLNQQSLLTTCFSYAHPQPRLTFSSRSDQSREYLKAPEYSLQDLQQNHDRINPHSCAWLGDEPHCIYMALRSPSRLSFLN